MVDSMITLFESTNTIFTTNGIGNLPDAISCVVTEELNGTYELEMEYPIVGKRYSDITLRRIINAKPNPYKDPQPFRIYSITKPLNGIITVNAQHISYDLSGYPVSPFVTNTLKDAFTSIKSSSAVACPFEFYTSRDVNVVMAVSKPSSIRSLLGGSEGSILDLYGGEYEFDKFLVTLHNNRGINRGVSIRYGKNLMDIKQEENCADVYTGVYPFWYSETDGLMNLSNKIVNSPGTYNFTRIYPLDLSQEWQERPSEDQLRSKTNEYIETYKIGIPKVSIDVSFLQLSQSDEYKDVAIIETVHLGDTVNVEFIELNVSATAKCVKIVYDAITNKYESIELGDVKKDITSSIVNTANAVAQVPTKTSMERAIEHATQLISGGLGGFVVLRSSSGGQKPDEILIMDTEDINTATKVWRWNQNGLGYSGTGYNGPFQTAITADGHIVANFIDTGVLDAAKLIVSNLVVGTNVTMGPNAIISWGQVTGEPDFTTTSDVHTILGYDYVVTGKIYASQIYGGVAYLADSVNIGNTSSKASKKINFTNYYSSVGYENAYVGIDSNGGLQVSNTSSPINVSNYYGAIVMHSGGLQISSNVAGGQIDLHTPGILNLSDCGYISGLKWPLIEANPFNGYSPSSFSASGHNHGNYYIKNQYGQDLSLTYEASTNKLYLRYNGSLVGSTLLT